MKAKVLLPEETPRTEVSVVPCRVMTGFPTIGIVPFNLSVSPQKFMTFPLFCVREVE